MEGCILVYPLNEWEKLTNGLSKLNVFDPKKRFFMREFMKYVNECELDSQNRILIPTQLVNYAKLNGEIVILGMLDKLEIWDPKTYDEYENKQDVSYEEVAKSISEEIFKENV
jgi:MraZ protein